MRKNLKVFSSIIAVLVLFFSAGIFGVSADFSGESDAAAYTTYRAYGTFEKTGGAGIGGGGVGKEFRVQSAFDGVNVTINQVSGSAVFSAQCNEMNLNNVNALAFEFQNVEAGTNAKLDIKINDTAATAGFDYLTENANGTLAKHNGTDIVVSSLSETAGYIGEVYVSLSAFPEITQITSVTITSTADGSVVKNNFGKITLVNIKSDDTVEQVAEIWQPQENNYSVSGTSLTKLMGKGEFYVYSGAGSYNNLGYYVSFESAVPTSKVKGLMFYVDTSDVTTSYMYFAFTFRNGDKSLALTATSYASDYMKIEKDGIKSRTANNLGADKGYKGMMYFDLSNVQLDTLGGSITSISVNSPHKSLIGTSYSMADFSLVTQGTEELFKVSTGESVSSDKYYVAYGDNVAFTVDADEKEGYELKFVLNGEDLTSAINDGVYAAQATSELNAQVSYAPIKFEIKYYDELGSLIDAGNNPVEYTIESDTINLENAPEKDGYEFIGWYDSAVDGNLVVKIEKGSVGNKNLYSRYAKVSPTDYTIDYYDGDVKLVPGDNPSSYNSESGDIVLKNAPAKDGYEFVGWYDSADFVNKVTEIKSGSQGNITLFAKYVKEYSITYYDENGDTIDCGNPERFTSETKSFELAAAPEKRGKTFVGWFDDAENGSKVTKINTATESDLVLYARYELIVYSITYYDFDGSQFTDKEFLSKYASEYTIESETIVFDDAPYIEGKLFIGWYSALNDGEPVLSIESGSIGNVEVFALYLDENEINYSLSDGAMFFAYDSFNASQSFSGSVLSELDGINIRSKKITQDVSAYAGIRVNTSIDLSDKKISFEYNQTVKGKNIGIRIKVYTASGEFSLKPGSTYSVNGTDYVSADGLVYPSTPFDSGFLGVISVNSSDFDAEGKITAISFDTALTSYLRHNFGNVYCGDESETVWSCEQEYETYLSEGAEEYVEYSLIKKGEIKIAALSKNDTTTWNFEQFGYNLPSDLVGADGFINIKNIKGIAIRVQNVTDKYFSWQTGIIDAKYAEKGDRNNALAGYRWITQSSTVANYNYSDGKFVTGGAMIVPAGFDGIIFLPFNTGTFAKANASALSDDVFPEKILPYIYGGLPCGDAVTVGSSIIIKDIMLVRDDAPYLGYAVQIFDSKHGSASTQYENYVNGASVNITITPDRGYKLKSGTIFIGENEIEIPSGSTSFSFVITDTAIIDISFEAIEYSIVYRNVEGCENENPPAYTIADEKIVLGTPRKDGFVFKGWYSNENFEGEAIEEIETADCKEIVLYAKWEEISSGCAGGCSGNIHWGTTVLFAMSVIAGQFLFIKKKKKL